MTITTLKQAVETADALETFFSEFDEDGCHSDTDIDNMRRVKDTLEGSIDDAASCLAKMKRLLADDKEQA